MQLYINTQSPILPNAPIFTLSLVFIPAFDTIRVFSQRIRDGKPPFTPDKTHIHHILTNNGWSHSFTAKLLCVVHGILVVLSYFLKTLPQEVSFLILMSS